MLTSFGVLCDKYVSLKLVDLCSWLPTEDFLLEIFARQHLEVRKSTGLKEYWCLDFLRHSGTSKLNVPSLTAIKLDRFIQLPKWPYR